MAKRKLGGLGKGLDSLFEDLPMTEDASPDLTRLPVREIEPDPDLPEYVRDQVRTGDISAGHAKALLSLGSPEQMSAAADQIIAKDMSVRQAEALCRKMSKPPKPAKEEDAFTRPVLAVEVEGALKETTGSEVHVDYKGGKGVLHIAFYSDAQLQQFAGLLGQYDPEQAAEAVAPSGEDEA